MGSKFLVEKVTGIILNVCVLLLMQILFYEKDVQKQFFVAFSFVAGKETVKYIVSMFSIMFHGLCNHILDYFIKKEAINTLEKSHIWINIFTFIVIILCVLLYTLLLSVFLYLISKKFVKKDYLLQTHENIFLILPCIAALCIAVTIKMMILSVENGMIVIIYNTVPATKF